MQCLILVHWMLFYATSVIDKIIPDVYPLWAGADFYTLFIKFFASLGITDPIFATMALAGISGLEIIAFVCFLFAFINLLNGRNNLSEPWFYRGILSSIIIFSLFSIGDQIFGDRFALLEHGIFWVILLVSWVVYKWNGKAEILKLHFGFSRGIKMGIGMGSLITILTSFSLFDFSQTSFVNKIQPVNGEEVVKGVFKFDFPFLGDKITLENTINNFQEKRKDLKINYIYTGPDELNSKKKTHILLYVFTEPK